MITPFFAFWRLLASNGARQDVAYECRASRIAAVFRIATAYEVLNLLASSEKRCRSGIGAPSLIGTLVDAGYCSVTLQGAGSPPVLVHIVP